MAKIVPIDAVRASEYNPRKNDEKRLALTEMSLRKLGFLLPIYADMDGEPEAVRPPLITGDHLAGPPLFGIVYVGEFHQVMLS